MGKGASKQRFLCHISIFRGRTEGNASELNFGTPSKISEKPRIDLRMHKLDMSLTEKAPRFQCVRCSPLRSCSGRPCIHSKGASLCSALLCSALGFGIRSEFPVSGARWARGKASRVPFPTRVCGSAQPRWVGKCRGAGRRAAKHSSQVFLEMLQAKPDIYI